jgi:glycosyltransferase involved in cell wall biosynthesis
VVSGAFPRDHEFLSDSDAIVVSVIMPCLNEEEALADCIREALDGISKLGIRGEVVVVDNGSTDESVRVAVEAGARVILEPNRGYGFACRKGLAEARGRYLVLGDADGTYDFGEISRFILPLDSEADMVMGGRLNDRMESGAMPLLHRRIGNPFLTKAMNIFFSVGVSDAHCGLRSIRRDIYSTMSVHSGGMEFASEFLIEATRAHVRITEVPIIYRRRAGGDPKLRTFRDGWRHLKLMVVEAASATTESSEGSVPAAQRHRTADEPLRERA